MSEQLYTMTGLSFPSSDGIHTVAGYLYQPKEGQPRGIVQLSHGMIDYVGRYEELAAYLTAQGYIFAGNDHLGHGRTAVPAEDLGFFAERGGVDFLLRDLHQMNKLLREKFPDLPIVLFGHSMGSFLARLYAAKYPHTISALIIHGTGGSNPALPAGMALAAIVSAFRGGRHRSKMIASLAFAGYNSKFPKEEGENAWLTRDCARVADRPTDPFANYTFTVSGYRDLFRMVGGCNAKSWYADFPKSLRTLVISGDADPVGAYGKGPREVYGKLLVAGCRDVRLKLYDGARHELFNETNREQVYADLLAFLEGSQA